MTSAERDRDRELSGLKTRMTVGDQRIHLKSTAASENLKQKALLSWEALGFPVRGKNDFQMW